MITVAIGVGCVLAGLLRVPERDGAGEDAAPVLPGGGGIPGVLGCGDPVRLAPHALHVMDPIGFTSPQRRHLYGTLTGHLQFTKGLPTATSVHNARKCARGASLSHGRRFSHGDGNTPARHRRSATSTIGTAPDWRSEDVC